MTELLIAWTIAGFLLVFFHPAKSRSSQWFQMAVGGPLVWLTMWWLYRYWKRFGL